MRNKTTKLVLDASAGTALGTVITCTDAHAFELFVGFKLTASAANFVATVQFAGNVEDDGDYANWPVLTTPVIAGVLVADTEITSVAGILTFATGLEIGVHRGVVRIPNPPPFVVPRFVFGSGGGTYGLVLKASY